MTETLNRRLKMCVTVLLLASWFMAFQGAPMRTNGSLGSLQGHWEGHGPGGDCSVTISGNSLHFKARPDFWFETTFTLPSGTDPSQLHATIVKESSPEGSNIGTVVVAVFKIEGETLTLGVIEDFDAPPEEAVVGEWEWAMDVYYLERGEPRSSGLIP